MTVRVDTGPTIEPLSVADVKKWSGITINDDDRLIRDLIIAARRYAEAFMGRAILTQTIKEYYDCFRGKGFNLHRAPVQSVTSIEYVDLAGATQTLATSVYETDLFDEPSRIRLAEQQHWPTTKRTLNAVTITYVAGWQSASDIPKNITSALSMLVDHWYEHRSPVTELRLDKAPLSVDHLLTLEDVIF